MTNGPQFSPYCQKLWHRWCKFLRLRGIIYEVRIIIELIRNTSGAMTSQIYCEYITYINSFKLYKNPVREVIYVHLQAKKIKYREVNLPRVTLLNQLCRQAVTSALHFRVCILTSLDKLGFREKYLDV